MMKTDFRQRAAAVAPPPHRAPTTLTEEFVRNSEAILRLAMRSLFERLNNMCEGAIAVDANARIVWISDKYVATLGLASAADALGREVEEVLPNSLMREVVRTGQPLLLDIMAFGEQSLVVTRMPVLDEDGKVIGAIGFVLYDRVHYLKPLVAKFASLQSELAEAQSKLVQNRRTRFTLSSFVGSSAACLEVKRQARRAAQADATVLLLGEKCWRMRFTRHRIGRAARSSRSMSRRSRTICSKSSFLVRRRAHTPAPSARAATASSSWPTAARCFWTRSATCRWQCRLSSCVCCRSRKWNLGSNTVCKVDVRIIAATSIDLKQRVQEGKFRSDLYYRLNVLPIVVPPLRERVPDIEVLCDVFLEQIAARTGKPHREIAPEAIAALSAHEWPGNVRELQNVLERATMLTDNCRLTADDFAPILPAATARSIAATRPARNYAELLEEFERTTLHKALGDCGSKVTATAKMLGMSRAGLYRKLASLGIKSRN